MLLDSTNFNASDSNESLLPDERGSFVDDKLRQGGNRESIKAEAKRNAQKNAQAQSTPATPLNRNQRTLGSPNPQSGPGGVITPGIARQKLGRDPQRLSGYGGAGGPAAMKSAGAGGAKSVAGKSPISGQGMSTVNVADAAKEAASFIPVVGDKIAAKIDKAQQDIGRLIGFLLWLIWGLLAIVGLIISITITGVLFGAPVIFIFNLLLISPRLVYRLTVWILDLFGIGESLQAAEKSGAIDKRKIRIGGFEKITIVLFDLLIFILVVLMFAVFVYFGCWLAEQTGGIFGSGPFKLLLTVYDWWNNTEYAPIVDELCSAVGL